jgi:hypothetical protein
MNNQNPAQSSSAIYDLSPDLIKYYSSQAKLMLDQYENINQLLSPTDDWTAPGDFCEILFRDFLRKFLPSSLSADKGFCYGRSIIDGKDSHCPEIDILIHDTKHHRPLFRMGDFVVVKPQAVRGMIQVKRTLTQTQVRRGMRNVALARWQLQNHRSMAPQLWGNSNMLSQTFTAIIGFGDKIGNNMDFYNKLLIEWHKKIVTYNPHIVNIKSHIIGSLSNLFLHSFTPQ